MTVKLGLDVSTMDSSVKAADDFYNYCNGKWNEEIPKDKSQWGFFQQVDEKVLHDLHLLVNELADNHSPDVNSESYKVGTFWKVALDIDTINQQGISPVEDLLSIIDAVKCKADFVRAVATLHRNGVGLLFSAGTEADMKDSRACIMWVTEGGLGLPNREYYFDEDKEEKRKKYVEHVAEVFVLAGYSNDEAHEAAKTVWNLELGIAKVSYTNVERRNIPALYNPMEPSAFPKEWDWKEYFATCGGDSFDFMSSRVLCSTNPKHLAHVTSAVTEESLNEWKTYAKWHILHSMGWYLSEPFVDANFQFFRKELTGQEEMQARWKRMVRFLNSSAGELLGKVYCERFFPESSKQKMAELVQNLISALRKIVTDVDWMAAPTREAALKKLDKFGVKIGYPDKWIDYTDLKFTESDSLVVIVRRMMEFEHLRDWARANKPVDRSKWSMPPQVVNAYYHPLLNEIVFPAAILQFPAFDPDRDICANYGAIGAVIGHECTHGFDDQGRQFDSEGNLVEWWTAEDIERYNTRKQVIIDQFSAIEVIDGQKVNGELTQGENIADIGGLKVAYGALMTALESHSEYNVPIDGFTPAQRFFIAWGQFWRTKSKSEYLKMALATDPHAPGEVRASVPVRNLDEFMDAFSIATVDKMYMEKGKRGHVW